MSYDSIIAREKNGRPFGIDTIREIQLSSRDVLADWQMQGKAFQLRLGDDFCYYMNIPACTESRQMKVLVLL